MTVGSPLRPFQSQPTISKQTDLLIQTLLNFGRTSNGTGSPSQIIELGEDELAAQLAKLSIDQDPENQPDDLQLKKLIRSRLYVIHSSHLHAPLTVRSWTMSEHVYRRLPCPFPTMARGLFTRENLEPDRKLGLGRHSIVARGYDKFFNIDELPSTKWEALEKRSQAPYHLTLKTNGCIIFLAALTPSDLLVTSKHATGGSQQEDEGELMTHSAVGERWVKRHLANVGLSRAELAQELWEANATAVAELTDDEFEEHVIATPADQVGLNLHGINLNTPELITYPPEIVAQCAKRWGMHPTPFTTVDHINAVKEHCQIIQSQGWVGRQGHVEGVVVRGTPRDRQPTTNPNLPTSSIFWKVKFEEPYLTYREWRELTRKMLNEMTLNAKSFKEHPSATRGKSLTIPDSEELAKVLKVNVKKIHNPDTRLYVHWVLEELLNRPQTFELWQKNRGIIATREAFFRWRVSKDALNLIPQLGASSATGSATQTQEDGQFDKTLLVPIGIPGCGKTTLAIALKTLTNCGHTQSDDITTKKTGPAFIEHVKSLLLGQGGSSLVIADKNNHLKTHRAALAELIEKLKQGVQVKKGNKAKGSRETELVRMRVRLIALTWDLEAHPSHELHRIAAQRIVTRGENHQSLRPELTSGGIEAHDAILWRFLKTLEVFDPDINPEDHPFSHIIQLKFVDSIETNLVELCAHLHRLCPDLPNIEEPHMDSQRIKDALEIARRYKPLVKKEMKVDPGMQSPRYFGVKLDVDLTRLIGDLFGPDDEETSTESTMTKGRRMYKQLVQNGRITALPHLTLVHQNQTEESVEMKKLWEDYQARVLARKVHLGLVLGPKLIWNDRVMIIEATVRPSTENEPHSPPECPTKTKRYHVTIGTAGESIRPVEGFGLLHQFFFAPPSTSASLPPHPPMHFVEPTGTQVLFIDVKTVCVDGILKGLT